MTLLFYITLSLLALAPAIIIPRSEWDVQCWFLCGGAVWLLFMLAPLAELIHYLWG